ncbi:MAG: SRPBCC family protein, partial [Nocardioides sp.]
MSDIEQLHTSVDIAAPPERVWSLVTDLQRMASWSPQVVKTFVRGPVQRGTRALNLNRRGPLLWPTRSKVVTFEPHREFAFRIKDNAVIWAFVLEPTAAGTRLVHERRTPDGIT